MIQFLEEIKNIMIETKKLAKSFTDGEFETKVLREIDFKLKDGEFVSIMGRSGAG